MIGDKQKRAVALYKKGGLSFTEIGAQVGLTRNAVAGAVRRAGAHRGVAPDGSITTKVIALVADGMSIKEAARLAGTTLGAANTYVRRRGHGGALALRKSRGAAG